MLVFVYGTLKKGFHNHFLLENSEFIGKAVLNDGNLYKYCPSFPSVSLKKCSKHYGVKGEVYSVTDDVFKDLDLLEGYPSFYNRSLKKVNVEGVEMVAWVYHIDEFDSYLIKKGEW